MTSNLNKIFRKFISKILAQKNKDLIKALKDKEKEIKILNKLLGKYARAIELMADGIPYEKLPKSLK